MARGKKVAPLDDSTPELPEGVVQDESENTIAEAIKNQVKKPFPGNWIDMDEGAVASYQAKGLLAGYNPKTGKGLLKEGA